MYLVVCIVLTIIGLFVKTHLPGADPDIAIIQGFSTLLPLGLRGLAIVVFFAAMMSSIDTYAYTAASAVVQDFFKGIGKAQTVQAIRYSITALMIVGCIVSIAIQNLISAAYIFAGFYIVIAIPAIASAIKPTISARTINIALVCALLSLGFFVPHGLITNTLTPALAMKVMGGSLVGLIIGGLLSRIPFLR